MHDTDDDGRRLMADVFAAARERLEMDPPPLDRPRTEEELRDAAGRTITPDGLGPDRALALFTDVLAPACLSMDHPRYFAFVPNAATETATLFDLLVGASNIYGGSWLEGSGAVHAENEALAWLAELLGMPGSSGGTFVSGGSIANLSALAAARHRWRSGDRGASGPAEGPVVVVSNAAHSSIGAALDLLDLDPLVVGADAEGRFRPDDLPLAEQHELRRRAADVVAVVGTAGLTNTGGVDDLGSIARLADSLGTWFHVDAAYGGGALCSLRRRSAFAGIEHADSVTIDPHKWLFAPYDCAAVVYRDPAVARATFTQRAAYLDAVNEHDEWNPSDYAPHLSRRARGLPFWFSLAVHGTDAYRDAVDATLDVTEAVAEHVRAAPHLDLVMEPELSVVLVRRHGWDEAAYHAWCQRLLDEQVGFVVPTTWQGETLLRLCIVNPRTTVEDALVVLPPQDDGGDPDAPAA